VALDAAGAAAELRALEARTLARMGAARRAGGGADAGGDGSEGGAGEEGGAEEGGWDVVLQLAGAVLQALPNATVAAAAAAAAAR
jgi:hypothetical protein